MNCGNCGAPGRLDRERGLFVCDYCHSEFMPPIGDDGVQVLDHTRLKCPGCQSLLAEGRIEAHPLLYCTQCRGMLVEMGRFVPLIETLRSYCDRPSAFLSPRGAEDAALPRICPHCSGPMEHHPYGGPGNIWLDTCERCAVNWLDKGELQKIASAPDRSGSLPLYSEYASAGEREEQSARSLLDEILDN